MRAVADFQVPRSAVASRRLQRISSFFRRTGNSDRERGSAALELVVVAPVLLGLLGLVIAAGRTSIAQGSVDAAARYAARQASIALTPQAALAAGRSSALDALRADGLDCSPIISIDTAGFGVPPGQPAAVSATVTCTVPLSNLALPGLPGHRTLTASFRSPLDQYRSR